MNAVARFARFAVVDSIRQHNEKFHRIERLIFPKKFACEFRPDKLCTAAGSPAHISGVLPLVVFVDSPCERGSNEITCPVFANLALPNVRTCAPARNKNQSRTALAGLDNPQRYAFANIHLPLPYPGSGIHTNDSGVCSKRCDQKDNWSRKQNHCGSVNHGRAAGSSSLNRHGEILPNRSRVAPAMSSAFDTPLSINARPVLSQSFLATSAPFSRTIRPRC